MSEELTSGPAPPQHSVSPAPPPPAETPPVLPPSPLPPTSVKPLLNPLQSLDTPPASTVAEPPRSPNPANEATDDRGRNVDLANVPSGPGSAVEPAHLPFSAGASTEAISAPLAEPTGATDMNGDNTDAAVDMGAEIKAHGDRSPLAIDAPVPASPLPPHDEIQPSAEPGLIPPAVSTPTVIAAEDDEMLGVPPSGGTFPPAPTPLATDLAPASQPPVVAGPAPVQAAPPSAPAPAPTPSTAPPAPLASEPASASQIAAHPPQSVPMDIDGEADAAGDDEEMSASRQADGFTGQEVNGAASASLKRSGEELVGSDEKRRQTHSESPFQAPPAAPSAPAPAPAPMHSAQPVHHAPPIPAPGPFYSVPAPAAPVTYVPTQYAPPPPRDAGPTTPLTQTQHKHLINAVRSLKKSKDAVNFLYPVDTVLFGIPHYVNIVKNPMDLGTVETKLVVSNPRGPPKDKSKMGNWDTSKGKYGSVSEVVQDVRQIWENTRMFNGPDHLVSQMATRLEASFEKSLATLPAEPTSYPTYPSPGSFAAPAPPVAGPSTAPARRASISQPPAPRRSSDGLDRPKREIHPPPSKELPYANDQVRKKRRPDAQINYLSKQIRIFETKNMDLAGPFLYPVEEIIAQIPDYTLVVKNPIDLNHIKAKINEGEYDDAKQLNSDFRMMCKNAMTFNPATHDVHMAAARFLKLWEEKWRALPPKEVPVVRSYSEDLVVDDVADADEDEFENDPTIVMLREQIETMQGKIEQIKAERRKNRPPKPSKKAKAPRKQSISQAKMSPGANGNGHGPPKKAPRKSKDVSYHEDNGMEGDESEEEVTTITLTQKQELAEKITQVDGVTLQKAIDLIAKSTGLDGDEEIELDIDSLPSRTIVQLYNLVCRGRTPKKGPGRPKQYGGGSGSGVIQGKKPGRKPGKKHMNEQEEAERIKRMEEQLQSFDGPRGGAQGGQMMGQSYDESDSSDDEESEED